MSHFFQRSPLKSFIRNPLKSRNESGAGGKVQVCYIQPEALFKGGFLGYFHAQATANPPYGFTPAAGDCLPYRKFKYHEILFGNAGVIDANQEIKRRTRRLIASITGNVNAVGWLNGFFTLPNLEILQDSSTTLELNYSYDGVAGNGYVLIELSDPYTDTEQYEDLVMLMNDLDIDAQPYPGVGKVSVFQRTFDIDGNIVAVDPAPAFPFIGPLPNEYAPTTRFQSIVGVTDPDRLHPVPEFSQLDAADLVGVFWEGFFLGGYSRFRDFGGSGGYIGYGWQPMLTRSRWKLGNIKTPYILASNYDADPRLTGCVIHPSNIPRAGFDTWYGPVQYKQFGPFPGDELKLGYSQSHTMYLPLLNASTPPALGLPFPAEITLGTFGIPTN